MSQIRRLWLILNLSAGGLLWFGLFTDFSWDNVWANVWFPPATAFIASITLLSGRRRLSGRQRRLQSLSCLPSIIAGSPYAILIVLAVVPPFLLATLFWCGEQSGATIIQRLDSPDGLRTAEVRFRPVGAYSGGSGRIEIYLRYKWLPFVKRDLAYIRVSHADENTRDYVQWLDDETIFVPECDARLQVRQIRWDIPAVIKLPVNFVFLLLKSP
jgi:hypothetical protein